MRLDEEFKEKTWNWSLKLNDRVNSLALEANVGDSGDAGSEFMWEGIPYASHYHQEEGCHVERLCRCRQPIIFSS